MRWIMLLLVGGCGSTDAVPAQAVAEAPPPILAPALLQSICRAEPCGGDSPSVNVYRDSSGQIRQFYRLYGACSHSPGIYFDADGTQTETIPEQPVIPGSPEAQEFEARHQRHVGGLTMTDVVRCLDGMRVGPR